MSSRNAQYYAAATPTATRHKKSKHQKPASFGFPLAFVDFIYDRKLKYVEWISEICIISSCWLFALLSRCLCSFTFQRWFELIELKRFSVAQEEKRQKMWLWIFLIPLLLLLLLSHKWLSCEFNKFNTSKIANAYAQSIMIWIYIRGETDTNVSDSHSSSKRKNGQKMLGLSFYYWNNTSTRTKPFTEFLGGF